ncbi:hypothetical protein [uncultured Lactobacillus sp.]|uniref:hypothetical protein n=1 Tax=uncultured Lactobacillus sp. TaxID=153152 RepID=UPI0025DC4D72|nr:hypothetical protein [uncultured Lactobacillus sp.]
MTDLVMTEDVETFVDEIMYRHDRYFTKIQNKFTENNKLEEFIWCILGDYIWDSTGRVCNAFDEEIIDYWNGDPLAYAKQLVAEIKSAKNIIVNTFIMYFENEEEFLENDIDVISYDSTDYFYSFGASEIVQNRYGKKLRKLSMKKIRQLNDLLDRVGLPILSRSK